VYILKSENDKSKEEREEKFGKILAEESLCTLIRFRLRKVLVIQRMYVSMRPFSSTAPVREAETKFLFLFLFQKFINLIKHL